MPHPIWIVLFVGFSLSHVCARSNAEDSPPGNESNRDQTSQPEEWPQWRGPRGDGSWNAPRLPERWPADGLRVVWRKSIGGGYAGVTVSNGRAYVMDRQTDPDEVERLLCFDAKSGRRLWVKANAVKYGDLDYGNGPRSAPTVLEGCVYSLGTLGQLNCRDAMTGKLIWSAHLIKDFEGRMPMWGYAAAPAVLGDLLFVQPGAKNGNGIIAMDRLTGEVKWHSLNDEAAYAPPIFFRDKGKTKMVCWTPSHIRCLDPSNGKLFWSIPYKVTYGVSITTPIVRDGIVFVSGYWEGARAIRLTDKASVGELVWQDNRFLRGVMSQPLYRDGLAYLIDKQYGLTCFELRTGKKIWDAAHKMTPRDRNPQASLVWLNDGDRAIILNSDGDLILARLNSAGYHEQSRTNIIGHTWAHPAFAGNRAYARSDTELVCVEMPISD